MECITNPKPPQVILKAGGFTHPQRSGFILQEIRSATTKSGGEAHIFHIERENLAKELKAVLQVRSGIGKVACQHYRQGALTFHDEKIGIRLRCMTGANQKLYRIGVAGLESKSGTQELTSMLGAHRPNIHIFPVAPLIVMNRNSAIEGLFLKRAFQGMRSVSALHQTKDWAGSGD